MVHWIVELRGWISSRPQAVGQSVARVGAGFTDQAGHCWEKQAGKMRQDLETFF